ncbi:MAG: protein-glutamate O-methyltransferase CheR [Terriglobia bacterium]
MNQCLPRQRPPDSGDSRFPQVFPPIPDADFVRFQRLIENESGIHLPLSKKPLLLGRLSRRLRELGLSGLPQYYEQVIADRDECTRMIDCISTNETHFFREPLHFDFLLSRVFPEWIAQASAGMRPREIRVWSAGCSTGEEPYSLAMVLFDHFPPSAGWHIEILATDISTRALARARAGIWPMERARHIPPQFLKAFMLRGIREEEGKVKAGPEISAVMRFEQGNILRQAAKSYPRPFDIIFCRNVLIYFQPETKARVIDSLINHLAPEGYLFVGHSESLNSLTSRVRSIIPTVYVVASES